jgi:hypothetical protein
LVEKNWIIPSTLQIWYLAICSCLPCCSSTYDIISPVTKMSHVLPTTGWHNRHHSVHLGWTNLSYAVTSASTVKVTTLQNSIPVTPSLYITSFVN